MAIVIRPLAPDDYNAWANLWRGYLNFYQTSVHDDVYETSFARMLSSDHPSLNGLVAVSDRHLVGLVHFIFHPHNWRLEDVCYLQDLYVDPAYRGGGIGRSLISAVYAAADANETPSVYWLTQDFNQTARRLYDTIATVTPFIKYNR